MSITVAQVNQMQDKQLVIGLEGVITKTFNQQRKTGNYGDYTIDSFILRDAAGHEIKVNWMNSGVVVPVGSRVIVSAAMTNDGPKGASVNRWQSKKDGSWQLAVKASKLSVTFPDGAPQPAPPPQSAPPPQQAPWQPPQQSAPQSGMVDRDYVDILMKYYSYFIKKEVPSLEAERMAVHVGIGLLDGKLREQPPAQQPSAPPQAPAAAPPPAPPAVPPPYTPPATPEAAGENQSYANPPVWTAPETDQDDIPF